MKPQREDNGTLSLEPRMHLEELIVQASRHLPATSSEQPEVTQPAANLVLLRRCSPSTIEAMLYEPVLCLILQGSKQVWGGEQTLSFGAGECLLVSHAVPVRSRVTTAPYLAVVFKIEVATIRALLEEVAHAALDKEDTPALVTRGAPPELLDALRRYLALFGSPADAKVLGPLISKEIHYRLLAAPFGGTLRSLIRHDSSANAIARAISHIRGDIRSTIAIPELARRVGMSASAFHKHFKTITLRTPLQYQKELRLLEARRLLTMDGASVTAAAYEVGYESSSQFSREYARQFGVVPRRDMASAAR